MSYQFLSLQKLKNNQPTPKAPAVHLVHLEEEGTGRDEDEGSNGPNRIDGVTEEFMVYLARAVKDAQTEEKCCYHCNSLEHFICNCLLMKTLREKLQFNGKEGTVSKEGSPDPSNNSYHPKYFQTEVPKA